MRLPTVNYFCVWLTNIFPTNKTQFDLWVKSIGTENYTPTCNSLICSKHFDPECLEQRYNRVKLKKSSVPNISDGKGHACLTTHEPLTDRNIGPVPTSAATEAGKLLTEAHCSYTKSPEIQLMESNAEKNERDTLYFCKASSETRS